jgi:hypothetical protein
MGGKELQPWEQPGAVRRDREPHRSGLLLVLAVQAGVFGVLSVYWLFVDYGRAQAPGPGALLGILFTFVLALFGMSLGLWVWVTAKRDLTRMRAGLMDPEGLRWAESARKWAVVGWGLSMVTLLVLIWAVVVGHP